MHKVIITGASGMIGKGVLLECLDNPEIEAVLSIGRRSVSIEHPKLKEAFTQDFLQLEEIKKDLKGYNALFHCMGVSAAGMSEEDYRRLTKDYTLHLAKTFLELNPDSVMVYVSGTGTDSSEKGSARWARVKGETENALLAMPFKKAVMFRPGAIQPKKGIKSRTQLYQVFYIILTPFWPLMNAIFGDKLTDTIRIGQAMMNVLKTNDHPTHPENAEINALAKK